MSGYECRDCGYEPTEKELQRGTCPQCHPPPPLAPRTALVKALRALNEASAFLLDPDPEDSALLAFNSRLKALCGDMSAELEEREAAR